MLGNLTDMFLSFLGAFECPVHAFLHIYCPGCGITRAILSLSHLDIIGSLRYNPMAIFLLIYIVVIVGVLINKKRTHESEKAKRDIKLVTLGLFGIWIAYFVVRNVLLVFFGIDIVGDFV